MADYYTPSVVQPIIPYGDMTPLDRILLTRVFDSEEHDKGLYFFTETAPRDYISIDRHELQTAIAASEHPSSLRETIEDQLSNATPDETIVELDLSGTSIEFVFQDIVLRSTTLRYVTIVSSFTCSKMRADGFGGCVTLVTAEQILGKSTSDILEDFLSETGLDQLDPTVAPLTEGQHA
jgi:hypothetical protein